MKQVSFLLYILIYLVAGKQEGYAQTYTISTQGTVSTCSGTFYDAGGGGNYGNNQNYTMTFCPSTAGQVISVNFTSFSTEATYDFLYIYDGNSTAAPLIGQFSGAPTLGTIKGSTANATGCLTFKFTSDGSTVSSGWQATISCTAAGSPVYYIPVVAGITETTCSGTFYDNGAGSNYIDNETSVITFCPATAGQVISVTFTSFSTESCCDKLYIYDGNTTGASLIGTYSGTSSPGTVNVTGSNATGCLTFKFVSDGNTNSSGWVATVSCVAPPPPVIKISTGGTVTTCNATFYDNGGSGSNYSDSKTYTMTICPSTAGQCIQAAFTSFNTESGYDYLYIYDASTASSPSFIGQYSGTISSGTITASTNNSSGCLTFVFNSDAATNASGWAANITCAACGTPYMPPNTDCNTGWPICSNSTLSGTSNSTGFVNDAAVSNFGCLDPAEHQSAWYFFSSVTTGTVGMTITPHDPNSDYDWAIWGPMSTVSCPPPGAPVRCSAADGTCTSGNITGMNYTATDLSEGAGCGGARDGWVQALPVIAGDKYIMLIDNWNSTYDKYDITWQLNAANLTCDITVLPIELVDFTARKQDKEVVLEWQTTSEVNSDYFYVERSVNSIDYEEIDKVKGAGNSSHKRKYELHDKNPVPGVMYYRLRETDYSGKYKYSSIASVDFNERQTLLNNIHPNPTNSNIYFDIYSPAERIAHIELMDFTGHIVGERYQSVKAGKTTINAPMEQLPPGIYSLHVTFDNAPDHFINKVVKQ